ncbi:BTB/POZ domain-containing protein FBL11 [Rhynchospora pubera]|uniref:BTB/POZ domain-containing protein FBL11 n=1 Tax=Rhynchospora pubera TaxID=906938 RepID=A0AAV8C1U8_9POAL|nr:BTB/POZ domain-containing protein FBL11 [Rhynchospora pubera]
MANKEEPVDEEEENETVVIGLTTSSPLAHDLQEESCCCVSTSDIQSWDLPLLLQSSSLLIRTQRSRLIQQSEYFCALLDGSFSESSVKEISVQWDPQIFLQILQSMFGCSIQIEPDNFLLLIEGALFFGVEALLRECEDWFRLVCSETSLFYHLLSLEYLVDTWNYGKEKCVGFIQNECVGCMARNFVDAVKSSSLYKVPFDMLLACTDHPDLTVYSEKQLCEALVKWSLANSEASTNDIFTLFRKVRSNLLPLSYASGLRRFYSEIGNAAVNAIFNTSSELKDSTSLNQFRIRITNYSKKLLLSGCPQMSEILLLISMLKHDASPSKIKQILNSSPSLICNSLKSLENKSFFSFPNVLAIDISGCHQLNARCTFECLNRAFPSLAILRASHCSQVRVQDLNFLINACPSLNEIDFSLSFVAGYFQWSGHGREDVLSMAARAVDNRCVRHLSKLTLEGHTDLNDRHLSVILSLTEMLSYLNIKGCSGLSDMALAAFLEKCLSIHSLLLCYTSFGKESVEVLCSDKCQNSIRSPTMASRLQHLHLDGCKGIDEFAMSRLLNHMTMIKEVSLRGTALTDEAIFNFTVSSLERLDISDTKVSMVGLRPLIRRNHNLRCLKATGCNNLHQDLTANSSISPLLCELIDNCNNLEEVALGWGFSLFSVLIEDLMFFRTLRKLTLGLGASPGLQFLHCLPSLCPLMESLVIRFQVTSDDVIRNLLESLKHLQVLELRYCLGDLTMHCFEIPRNLTLTRLRLEWVCRWMTNDQLALLTRTFCSLTEFSLSGCKLLNSYSQDIISAGWPGLTVLHLEECGNLTKSGVSSLLSCKGLEDLLLRHNGGGIPRTFMTDAASELPQLRILALDLCDACDGGFDSPSHTFLRTVKMSRCKKQKLCFGLNAEIAKPIHEETIILQWNSKTDLRTSIVKERI